MFLLNDFFDRCSSKVHLYIFVYRDLTHNIVAYFVFQNEMNSFSSKYLVNRFKKIAACFNNCFAQLFRAVTFSEYHKVCLRGQNFKRINRYKDNPIIILIFQ